METKETPISLLDRYYPFTTKKQHDIFVAIVVLMITVVILYAAWVSGKFSSSSTIPYPPVCQWDLLQNQGILVLHKNSDEYIIELDDVKIVRRSKYYSPQRVIFDREIIECGDEKEAENLINDVIVYKKQRYQDNTNTTIIR